MKNLEAQRAEIASAGKELGALPKWWQERFYKSHARGEGLLGEAMRHNIVAGDWDSAQGALLELRDYVQAAQDRIEDWASDFAGECQG